MSLRLKLILGNSLAILALLVLGGIGIRLVVYRLGIDQMEQGLIAEARSFQRRPRPQDPPAKPPLGSPDGNLQKPPDQGNPPPQGPDGQPNQDPLDRNPRPAFPETNGVIDFPAADGSHAVNQLPVDQSTLRQARSEGSAFGMQNLDGNQVLVYTFRTGVPGPAKYGRILQSTDSLQKSLGLIDAGLLVMGPCAVALAILISVFAVRSSLKPVRKMTDLARNIDSTGLNQRLPAAGNDEFGQLSFTLNEMLEKIESGFEVERHLLENQRRFTSDAAHELKSPLTVITGNVQLGQSMNPNPQVLLCLTEIEREAAAMGKIVQDLLLLSKLESANASLIFKEIPVIELFEAAIQGGPDPKGVPIHKVIVPNDLTIKGDEMAMNRLVKNLVENARNASIPPQPIILKASRVNQGVEIKVIDQGVGMSASAVSHLGERFFRVDEARTRNAGGTGLGLAICKGIVEQHGGTIRFESELGAGTIVTVWLPSPSE